MLKEISWHPLELAGVHVHGMDALYPMQWLTFRRESSMCRHVACIPLSQEDRQVNMDYALVHAVQHGMDLQQKVITFYDINCQYSKNLKQWLEANNFISLPCGLWIQPSIGLWHVHGHKAECFTRYAPNFISGAGHVDGEIMETLWSSLNIISPSAWGMATPHRQELLDFQMNDNNFLKMVQMHEWYHNILQILGEVCRQHIAQPSP